RRPTEIDPQTRRRRHHPRLASRTGRTRTGLPGTLRPPHVTDITNQNSHNYLDRLIEVEHLSKRYRRVTAVDDVTFSVPDGVITGFLVPNGAGKSTTMRAMLGIDRPTSGTALIDGLPLSGHNRPALVAGAVLDTSWFHPGRTGLAHLETVAASARLPVF